jgi:hypothetical protein
MADNIVIDSNRWVACFDILGFKELLKRYKNNLFALAHGEYKDVLKAAERQVSEWKDRVFAAWFSDTFLLYTPDDSRESFEALRNGIALFTEKLLAENIPVRGSLTVGEFYSDPSERIFIGDAVVTAYQYAEKLRWIGAVLTPEGRTKVEGSYPQALENTIFVEYEVPVKSESGDGYEWLMAVRLNSGSTVNGRNVALQTIEDMMAEQKCNLTKDQWCKVEPIYKNTRRFMQKTALK